MRYTLSPILAIGRANFVRKYLPKYSGINKILYTKCLALLYTNHNIINMKTEFFKNYEAPQVDVLEVEVEQGFAQSNGNTDNWGPGTPGGL